MIRIFQNWMERYLASEEAVLLLIILGLGLLVVVTMGGILAPMIASLIIAFLLQGVVQRLANWGVPHIVAVNIAFLLLVGLLLAGIFILFPLIWHQTATLFSEVPGMLADWQKIMLALPEKYPQFISEEQVAQIVAALGSKLGGFGQSVLSFSLAKAPVLIAVLVYLILVPILVFFFLKDAGEIRFWMSSFLPRKRPVMSRIWHEMNIQVANYVRGKVIEILIVGSVSFVCFQFLGLNYALLLALGVGLSVLVPYIGAAVITLPVAMIGFLQWGWSSEFYYLMIAYGIIQALDGNVLVPLLFSEAVNLHPVAIILAVLVFGGIWGFWGVFFAIPLATLIKAVLNAWPVANAELQSQEEVSEAS
ncbi:AI-2E family transporter [Pseudoteredinibacter isoporae]|uniref:Putative permease n=1 Tax=Pseudoteredinibacter isoporae TaxID=570281 RepID=A0A7X0JW46_9GAMM|nr:AI-2E family transporter [Pseudoteredinibacter isoporae]MBB6522803.1 putative permease [Pseudoteredinibacter isoporae]NHO88330.1 AI-2E family transporter [Pseudoteredinibacter isoporae]NIB23339.1 AI-2E family transporter [Pseudoteredinibacter isoporae]